MDRMQEIITQVAEKVFQRRDDRLKEIIIPILGYDKASEFHALLQKKDMDGIAEMLAEFDFSLDICFLKPNEEQKICDGWFLPIKEYTLYQGDRAIGSFRDI